MSNDTHNPFSNETGEYVVIDFSDVLLKVNQPIKTDEPKQEVKEKRPYVKRQGGK